MLNNCYTPETNIILRVKYNYLKIKLLLKLKKDLIFTDETVLL